MEIKKISDYVWEIPASEKEGMLVPARIYATEKLLGEMDKGVFEQVTNVACLPGIQKYSYCMPDGHWGYGFPIGGVAAFSKENGVISPGGIGFDINCGMRLIRTDLTVDEVQPKIRELVDVLFKTVPAGVGSKGLVKLSVEEFKRVMIHGVDWCVEKGYGWEHDKERIEEYGCIQGADPSKVSEKAISRGISQLGTLGSGNHYLEIQVAQPENIFDKNVAKAFGIFEYQILVMVHCGSRGFGHQVATDYLRVFDTAMKKYGIAVRDRELACAPFNSPEGQDYYRAMVCAANAAFANRQVIVHRVREGFSEVFGREPEDLGMDIIYDVAHNVAKIETHEVDGEEKELLVHRKGSTRCFGPGRKEIPGIYRKTGQPVIVGGSMETGSYLLVGTEKAMKETFGSTMHGSGRTMSRTAAKKKVIGAELKKKMEEEGIVVRAVSMAGLAEEAGFAYKDISEVVDTMEMAGISRKVVGLRPIGNIKG
jgi:tRNA-splicing ligase RtcB